MQKTFDDRKGGGLHGIIDSVDEDKIIVRAGDGTRLTFDRSAVREVVAESKA